MGDCNDWVVVSPAQENPEPFFGHAPCGCCGDSLAGNRYMVSYRESLTGPIYGADVCVDCFQKLFT